jgi:filamentous hemagglutinin family protein
MVLLPSLSRAQGKVPTTDIAVPALGALGSLKTKVDPPTVDQKGITTYTITEGTRSGFNLFHSFLRFTVGQNAAGQNDIANFSNIFNGMPGPPTNNIVSRVTGGMPSNIFGTIKTSGFGAANLLLINPAGVVFGPTATLNIGGAFFVSTADYVRFKDKDGPTLSARVVGGEVFSADSPFAFGFLGPSPPQPIAVNGSKLAVGTGLSFSLVGGDIQIAGPGTVARPNLSAPGGAIQIVSVASKGEAPTRSSEMNPASFTRLGEIDIFGNARLDVSRTDTGGGGGTVFIRGGRLIVTDSTLSANTGNVNGARTGIDVRVAEDVILANG